MNVIPQTINTKFLKCDAVLDVPIYYTFGLSEDGNGKVCPNPILISQVKGFVTTSPGFTIESVVVDNSIWDAPVIIVGSMKSFDEIQGTIKVNLGDTCDVPGYIVIKWRAYDSDGDICFEQLNQIDITADVTCCDITNGCLESKLTCK